MAQSKRKFSKNTFLVELFSIIATLNSQSVIWPKEGIYHQEIFENGWLLTSFYATRNFDCVPLIKIKHNFFKNTWKKPDPAIQNAESLGVFKSNILKFFRPTPKGFFNCHNHKGIRLMTRLRLGLSHLCEHKFNHNFQNCINLLCSCGMDIESMSHFFLPYLMLKDSLSWELQTKLIAN